MTYDPRKTRRAEARRQVQVNAIELMDIEQIATLPWAGNHWQDQPLFNKIEAWKKAKFSGTSRNARAARKRIDELVAKYGMGM